tara:strand:+ start:212 stop:448 length:237 start_codon:yes stop_codon:yes gene_type:complete
MHVHHRVDKLYWKLLIGITVMHMLEDSLMVTFFKFAPLPLWILYLIVLGFSGIMANYAYFITQGYTPMSVWKMIWNRK